MIVLGKNVEIPFWTAMYNPQEFAALGGYYFIGMEVLRFLY